MVWMIESQKVQGKGCCTLGNETTASVRNHRDVSYYNADRTCERRLIMNEGVANTIVLKVR